MQSILLKFVQLREIYQKKKKKVDTDVNFMKNIIVNVRNTTNVYE